MQHVRSIDEPSAIRVATEPHRTQILEILLSGPQTISSLGILLDKHPAWIRHHIKALEAADLVELSEVRTTRNYTEKFYRATAGAFTISMLLRPSRAEGPALMGLVSHDLAVELLASAEGERPAFRAAVTGSLDGLIGVRQGLADIAGCHLLDADTGEYNVPYARHILPDRDVVVVTLAHREQGLMTAPGNPLGLATITDVAERTARFINRNRGSGTRLWIDRALHTSGIAPSALVGYERCVDTHTGAAREVAEGRADAAIGIAAAAERFELWFTPLFRERYDLVMSEEVYRTEEAARLLDRLHTRGFKRQVSRIRGYDPAAMGDEFRLAV